MGIFAFSGGRYGIEMLVWVAAVPWLLWTRRITRWPHTLPLLGGPSGARGTAGNLSHSLVVLKITSVFVAGALGFLTAWVAAALAGMRGRALRWHTGSLVLVMLAVLGFGTWRLAQPSHGPTIPVAAVVTGVGSTARGVALA